MFPVPVTTKFFYNSATQDDSENFVFQNFPKHQMAVSATSDFFESLENLS